VKVLRVVAVSRRAWVATFDIILQTRGTLHPDGELSDFVSEYTGIICTNHEMTLC